MRIDLGLTLHAEADYDIDASMYRPLLSLRDEDGHLTEDVWLGDPTHRDAHSASNEAFWKVASVLESLLKEA